MERNRNVNINESQVANKWIDKPKEESSENNHLIRDPNNALSGFNLPRKQWALLNRFRSSHGRCACVMSKWGLGTSSSCQCENPNRTTSHIVEECPLFSFEGGLVKLLQLRRRSCRPVD